MSGFHFPLYSAVLCLGILKVILSFLLPNKCISVYNITVGLVFCFVLVVVKSTLAQAKVMEIASADSFQQSSCSYRHA